MYKVSYQLQDSSMVQFKWFKTAEEANEFSNKLGSRLLEVKQYTKPEYYPDAELDFRDL